MRVGLLGLILLVALSNLHFLRRAERYRRSSARVGLAVGGGPGIDDGVHDADANLPFVSVLVPARNEEENIEACLLSLLRQEYPSFEVVVVDDGSTDGTGRILARLEGAHDRLRVLAGRPLPDGWLGKHWACHQLAGATRGELLLFTDADTRHHPQMLRDVVAAQQAEGSDLLTGLPHEEAVSWGEMIVIPIISWAALALLPLGLAHRLKTPLLCMGIGQFMLFKRSSYKEIGGFEAVRNDPVDDMALARRVKSWGLRWRFIDLSSRVRCRMYEGFKSTAQGLGKSAYPALGYRPWVLAAFCVVLTWVYLGPIGAWASRLLGLSTATGPLWWASAAICLALTGWILVMWRFGHPWYRAFLYPLTILLTMGIALHSAVLFWRGRASWKGRALPGLPRNAQAEEEWGVD